jgi:chromosome segregation ATPase
MNIAQILVNIDPTPEWRSRALVVLGMETYSRALDQHAAHLYTIAREFKALLASDQAKFEAHRHSLVESAMQESEALLRAEKFLDTLKVEVKKRTDLVDSRKQEVEAAKGALAKATTDASAELNQLNAMQADLFRIQQRLGAAQERTRELELELQRLEPKR